MMGLRRYIAVAAITILLPSATTGCFGRFDLTRKLYRFNEDISNDKWIRWITFLVMTIVPVYGFGTLVDALLLNSIHFWTGERAISDAGTPDVLMGENGEVATRELLSDGSMLIQVFRADGSSQSLRLVRESDSVVAFDADGALIARVGDVAGRAAVLAD